MGAVAAEKTTAMEVLRHPARVRILEALNMRDELSPIQFLNEDLGRGLPSLKGRSLAAQLSHVAYHFRILFDAKCIEEVGRQSVRGSIQHFYRARSRAYFSDAEWALLGLEERCEISKVVLQSLVAQAEGAMLSGTFDSKIDRWLAWLPLKLDARGWADLTAALGSCFSEVEQIQQDAEARLAESAEVPTWATFGLLGFESPPARGPHG